MIHYQHNTTTDGFREGVIHTKHGDIPTPAFFPVTTFSDKYPLDRLVQPYLKRLSPCIMVSYHYARQMKQRPKMPLFVDSGGFASLFEGSSIVEHADCASIKTKDGEEIHPMDVLDFQERNADLGATLDFLIPPGIDLAEAKRRNRLTIQNALWALEQKRSPDLFLYASLQCWDEDSARESAREYVKAGFEGIAIGGLVPRIRDIVYVARIVTAVREEAPDAAIHLFGVGKLELLKELWQLGIESSDSSSYVRNALANASNPMETLPLAPLQTTLQNLGNYRVALVALFSKHSIPMQLLLHQL